MSPAKLEGHSETELKAQLLQLAEGQIGLLDFIAHLSTLTPATPSLLDFKQKLNLQVLFPYP